MYSHRRPKFDCRPRSRCSENDSLSPRRRDSRCDEQVCSAGRIAPGILFPRLSRGESAPVLSPKGSSHCERSPTAYRVSSCSSPLFYVSTGSNLEWSESETRDILSLNRRFLVRTTPFLPASDPLPLSVPCGTERRPTREIGPRSEFAFRRQAAPPPESQ
jgi:hypothetical protein